MKALQPIVLALLLAGSAALLPLAVAGAGPQADSIRYTSRITNINAVGLTVTNYGVIGNNFVSRSPSLEYPLGTGLEHMPNGGLWFGAHATDSLGAFIGVTTGTMEVGQGSSLATLTEFTPAGLDISLHSRSPLSQHYDPTALSDMDYRWTFSDRPARNGSGPWPEPHRPLNILVRASALSWSANALQDVLFLRFTIINLGAPLTGAWAGFWTELASGDRNSYSCWPPSSACGPGSWYSKAWLQYDASRRLLREHYCAALPVPGGCNLAQVPAWVGVQMLKHPASDQQITLAAWAWSPGNAARDEDTERYAIMSAGTLQNLTQPDLMPQTGDPVELIAIGPFSSISSGDSVFVDFALVGGGDVAGIQAHADSAQAFYDNGFGAGSLVAVDPQPAPGLALAGARPNPASDRLTVSFSLPDASPARIDLWDVAGRRLRTREVGALGAGSHVVDLAGERLPAGIYLIRLTRGDRALSARAVVIR